MDIFTNFMITYNFISFDFVLPLRYDNNDIVIDILPPLGYNNFDVVIDILGYDN